MDELQKFLRLLDRGGRIVSSHDVSANVIALCRACGRFYVDERGLGYVYLPPFSGERAPELPEG